MRADPLVDLARIEGVPSAMTAARDAIDAVLRDRGMRVVTAEMTAAALVAGARASVELECLVDPDAEKWLPGAVRLARELRELSPMIRSAPRQVLARAHVLIGRGVLPDDDLGRIVVGGERAERINGLSKLLAAPTKAPIMVLAAVAHAELKVVNAFGAGDGIIARSVEQMILIEGGVDPQAATVPAAGHRDAGAGYYAAVEGYRSGGGVGVRDWLLHCARALARGAEESPLLRLGP